MTITRPSSKLKVKGAGGSADLKIFKSSLLFLAHHMEFFEYDSDDFNKIKFYGIFVKLSSF